MCATFILTSAFLQYTGTHFAINFKQKKDEKAVFSPLSANSFSPASSQTSVARVMLSAGFMKQDVIN